eukprot:6210072-Pleurochrysis_carterae.AAC.1
MPQKWPVMQRKRQLQPQANLKLLRSEASRRCALCSNDRSSGRRVCVSPGPVVLPGVLPVLRLA